MLAHELAAHAPRMPRGHRPSDAPGTAERPAAMPRQALRLAGFSGLFWHAPRCAQALKSGMAIKAVVQLVGGRFFLIYFVCAMLRAGAEVGHGDQGGGVAGGRQSSFN